jgi:serine protease AprX
VPDKEENCFGFGLPGVLTQMLQCDPWSTTLIFEDDVRPGYFMEWDDFPYPDSLKRKGRYYGQVWMTLAFAPALGNRWGTEYCQTHIEARFGTHFWQTDRKTKEKKLKFQGLVPPEHKNKGQLYESYQVEKLRKWAPVRTYFGDMGVNGEAGEKWRLVVQLLYRHGIRQELIAKPQRFALLMTIVDPDKKAPIYNEMAVKLSQRYQVQNLNVRSQVQIQQEE